MNRLKNVLVGLGGTNDDIELIKFTTVLMKLIEDLQVVFVNVGSKDTILDVTELETKTAEVFSECDCKDLLQRVQYSVTTNGTLDGMLVFSADREIDLVIVGRHENGLLTRRLAMEAPCSVLSVGLGSTPDRIKRIGVAIDFSRQSKEALSMGVDLAKVAGQSSLDAIHVLNPFDTFTSDEERKEMEVTKLDELKQFVNDHVEQDFEIHCLVETHAYPWAAIRDISDTRQLDLIVVATRGLTRSASILLGSVAEKTITESQLTLLIFKNRDQERLGLVKALLSLYRGE